MSEHKYSLCNQSYEEVIMTVYNDYALYSAFPCNIYHIIINDKTNQRLKRRNEIAIYFQYHLTYLLSKWTIQFSYTVNSLKQ
jgi:hypothetical protein